MCREEFEEHDWDFKLKDSVGNIIYTQEYEDQARIILWAWRELLVSSLAQGESTNVEQMIKDLLEIGHAKDIVELLTEGDGAIVLLASTPMILNNNVNIY